MDVTLCVDALGAQLSGIGRYTWELCQGLASSPPVDRLRFFARNQLIGNLDDLIHSRSTAERSRLGRAYQSVAGPWALRSSIVHGPNYFLPDGARTGVITIHDLSVFRYPEYHPAERISEFEVKLSRSVERARHIITDSETIRAEVIDFTGMPPSRVTAVPLGISPDFRVRRSNEYEHFFRTYGLPTTGYGLTVSSLEPRKRIEYLVRAWRQLPLSVRSVLPLVIAGAPGWKNDDLRSEIARGADEGWLISLGFIPEADLPYLYSGARVFAFPSVYEGFGLPPLEAMASGVPTIVSRDSCLSEVTKGGALLCDPEDTEAFAEVIQDALEAGKTREDAISAGIQIAGAYTWRRCVHETIAVYQRLSH